MSGVDVDRRRWPRWAGVAIVVVYAIGVTASSWFEYASGARGVDDAAMGAGYLWLHTGLFVTGFGWFALLGGLIVARQPHNTIGWLLAAVALMLGVLPVGNTYAEYLLLSGGEVSTAIALLAWPNNWYWYLLLGIVFIYIPLLFPTGQLLSPRWRWIAWIGGLSVGGMSALGAVAGTITTQAARLEFENPLGVPGLAHVEELPVMGAFGAGLMIGVLGGFVSLVIRARRSVGVERQQIRWLAAVGVLIPLMLGAELLGALLPGWAEGLSFYIVIHAIPLAIGLAVLRFRLYELDRIVSRTLAYAVVTGALVALYAGSVMVLQPLLRPLTGGSDLAVAASTLLVAAAFGPVRRRVQSVVDRRFARARYDAQRTVETFARQLRDEVDLDALAQELHTAASATVRPTYVSLWLPSLLPTAGPQSGRGGRPASAGTSPSGTTGRGRNGP